jgi:hypothetical protein
VCEDLKHSCTGISAYDICRLVSRYCKYIGSVTKNATNVRAGKWEPLLTFTLFYNVSIEKQRTEHMKKITWASNNGSKSLAIGTSAEYFGSCRERDFDELTIFPFSSLKETAASRKFRPQGIKFLI